MPEGERRRGWTCRTSSFHRNKWAMALLEDSAPVSRRCTWLSWLEMAMQLKTVSSPEVLAPLCTRTAISRLINCESCSLETLNHSFSILSRAASLTTLTRVPPCLPNTGDASVEVGERRFRRCGEGLHGGHRLWTRRMEGKRQEVKTHPPAPSPISVTADCLNNNRWIDGYFGGEPIPPTYRRSSWAHVSPC